MPTNLFQKIVFTLFTVCLSVVVFVLYNKALQQGGMSNQVFLDSGLEILLELPIAFVCQMLIAGPLSMLLAFRVVNPAVDQPRLVVLTITFMTVALMCPLMSLVSTVIFMGINSELIAHWFQAMFCNFPLAVFAQFFFIGPLVRLIFRAMFRKNSQAAGLSARPLQG